MQEADVDRIIPLIAEGRAQENCAEPTCITTHAGVGVWVPHRCSRAQCPVCADDGYTVQAADKTLSILQRRIKGRCAGVDHGKHGGKTLKLYKVIYSPGPDRSYTDAPKYNKKGKKLPGDQDKDKAKMYKVLTSWGAEYGYMIGHPYRGEHSGKATPAEIRASMDRSRQSWHYHGLVVAHWMERPPDHPPGVVIKLQCIGSFGSACRVDIVWAKAHKALTYAISHAALTRQVVCRFGHHGGPLAEPRPKTIPMWKHPDTEETRPLRPTDTTPEDHDMRLELTREIWRRYERKDDVSADYIAENGTVYRILPYTVVRADPDDTAGIAWDAELSRYIGAYEAAAE